MPISKSDVCFVGLSEANLLLTRFAETREALVSSVDKIIFVGSPCAGKMVVSRDCIVVVDDSSISRV